MMQRNRTYWICQIAGWSAYSAMGVAGAATQVGWSFRLVLAYTLFGLYSIALTDLLRREIRRRKWLEAISFGSVAGLAGSAVLLAAIQTFLIVAVDHALHPGNSSFQSPASSLIAWVSLSGVDGMWIVFYARLTAQRRVREREVTLQLALREAELRALESQINPHFLFNCLNSIRALVVENPPMAQDMITRFASILRYNLHRDPLHTVPLASEVEVVSDYLAIEGVRFEDRLRVHIEIEAAAASVQVPPMMLQTLVENAIKHGIGNSPSGGDLTIRATVTSDRLLVEVENTGQLVAPKPNSTQVGINNTRERLRILYGDRATLRLQNRGDSSVVASMLVPATA